MENILIWISKNKEWFFSGIGVLLLSAIFGLLRYFFSKSQLSKKNNVKQTQKAGKNSINIQSGHDTNVSFRKDKK